MTSSSGPGINGQQPVAAAGALLWRRRKGRLEVAMIHRPRYDDWSWPKGKLDPGETWAGAAVREVEEETGLVARLGMPLPRAVYPLPRGDLKEVRYWAAEAIGGSGALDHEVDDVRWMTDAQAFGRLTHVRDGLQLQALVDAERRGLLQTWPLLVVRHAEAIARGKWDGPDHDRPLDAEGSARAEVLAPLIAAYGITRVLSSPAERCMATVSAFAKSQHIAVRGKGGLSEEGYAEDPGKAIKHVEKALTRAEATVICTHRPLLPAMLTRLADQALPGSAALSTLTDLVEDGLQKGEALVCQVIRRGAEAKIATVERHRV
ncbi:NUDIX hydrolase [Luteipulveratus mongoliensis]|uniref:Phosphohistidine phosphatase n=1 Tax=Luteipulveratus mongoliensis TaxID=571913 RepID=A0A0K1JG48_9MICO|nr:NUDIX domain-containing protein [Luteipulveratus mongoliensis]AKU15679.1 phosphohistidine phosphatase [Luteipulveratus mongoliensis]